MAVDSYSCCVEGAVEGTVESEVERKTVNLEPLNSAHLSNVTKIRASIADPWRIRRR